MNLGRFVTSQASKMSDVERDELEQEVSKFGKVCSKKIETLATSIGHDEANQDTVVHQRTVIICLCSAVKHLGDELKALKAFRHQRASVRLQPEHKTLAASLDSDTFEASSVSPEELKELQEENKQLQHTLNHDIEAIHAVEQGTMEIAKFSEIFSAHLLEQEQQINNIFESILESTVLVKAGDEELRKAEQGSAFPLQFYVLLITSFSLGFLHWYSN